MASERLNVIALISGGKDSFFSALHCIANGHKIIALANLQPSVDDQAESEHEVSSNGTRIVKPDTLLSGSQDAVDTSHDEQDPATDDEDLNSFMYQTVGHQIIPLYAKATGLPLYCQPIVGGAKYEGRDYDAGQAADDETESMVPLLRTIIDRHPEANALCAGAILSTYQRTRVESVALRLGLTPVAYLWKYPVLPPAVSGLPSDDAQLLLDMEVAGLDARIIKVASAGLDEDFLWERVSCAAGVSKIKRGLRKFGVSEGSVLGEGGEFETLVVDGPTTLFQKKIIVPDQARKLVREGGGTSWLSCRGAYIGEKDRPREDSDGAIRVPGLFDPRFDYVSESISETAGSVSNESKPSQRHSKTLQLSDSPTLSSEISWTVHSEGLSPQSTIEAETHDLVDKIKTLLTKSSLSTTAITNAIIVLRRMSDFPAINSIYGALFSHPNPPSRITISSGDLLPDDCNIVIHLSVQPSLGLRDRKGLHVQSRSYWAPANIGPYSQAIDVPLVGPAPSSPDLTTTRSIFIAGQIPLWPALMAIPAEAEISAQITMSLQHLWRIAADQHVQLWSSAVAYFPRTHDMGGMRTKASLAAEAWQAAHFYATDGEEETGPDPWDRKYNPEFMTFGDATGDSVSTLPDSDVIKVSLEDDDDNKPFIPPFFAAEVEELPRQSGVEWHAHLGLAGVPSSSVEHASHMEEPCEGRPFTSRTSHLVVAGVLVRSTVSIESRDDIKISPVDILREAKRAYSTSLSGRAAREPYLIYIDTSKCGVAVSASGASKEGATASAIVPCHSLWSSAGEKLAAVVLFRG
ncbi:Diphthine--ammonia ligase like protein [Verticillium longisporum]